MKIASWAVVNTSGIPPASVQDKRSGTGISTRSLHQGELGLTAAADDPHHPVALAEAPDAGTHRRHLAGELESGDVLG